MWAMYHKLKGAYDWRGELNKREQRATRGSLLIRPMAGRGVPAAPPPSRRAQGDMQWQIDTKLWGQARRNGERADAMRDHD